MTNYFSLSPYEQAQLLEAVGLKMNVEPSIIEKDLWVVLALEALFSSQVPPIFIFKGGTSLSKAHSILERFSEDIDITIDRQFFGEEYSDQNLYSLSRNRRDKLIETATQTAHDYLQSTIVPFLKESLTQKSGTEIDIHFSLSDPLSLEVFYPTRLQKTYHSYIKPRIYIEFGVRGGFYPFEDKLIQSYLHQQIMELNDLTVPAKVLSPLRTFFEKVTLLHAEAYRPLEKATPLRLSRHYYDLHQLSSKGYLEEARKYPNLLHEVILNKKLLFPCKWASYDLIVEIGLKLIPNSNRLGDVLKDYQEMRIMVFGNSPPIEELLDSIQEIEDSLNKFL